MIHFFSIKIKKKKFFNFFIKILSFFPKTLQNSSFSDPKRHWNCDKQDKNHNCWEWLSSWRSASVIFSKFFIFWFSRVSSYFSVKSLLFSCSTCYLESIDTNIDLVTWKRFSRVPRRDPRKQFSRNYVKIILKTRQIACWIQKSIFYRSQKQIIIDRPFRAHFSHWKSAATTSDYCNTLNNYVHVVNEKNKNCSID